MQLCPSSCYFRSSVQKSAPTFRCYTLNAELFAPAITWRYEKAHIMYRKNREVSVVYTCAVGGWVGRKNFYTYIYICTPNHFRNPDAIKTAGRSSEKKKKEFPRSFAARSIWSCGRPASVFRLRHMAAPSPLRLHGSALYSQHYIFMITKSVSFDLRNAKVTHVTKPWPAVKTGACTKHQRAELPSLVAVSWVQNDLQLIPKLFAFGWNYRRIIHINTLIITW